MANKYGDIFSCPRVGYVDFPGFHGHHHKWENEEIGGQYAHEDTTIVYGGVQRRSGVVVSYPVKEVVSLEIFCFELNPIRGRGKLASASWGRSLL